MIAPRVQTCRLRQPLLLAWKDEPTAAYVHLPFCKRKCRYCDFPVIAVGMGPPEGKTADNMQMYVDFVWQEIRATRRLNHSGPLETVFFGGGTPSLISLPLLEQIMRELESTFGIATGAEISIEADPGTFDAARLRSYMSLGINRVSVGVQAFQEDLLQLLGRGHDLRDVYRAIEAVYAAGVPSWSLDLMSGLPHLTPELWQRSLESAVDADPHHLSTYDLQVEEHTPFARLYRPGERPLPADDVAAAMYCTASSVLRGAGFEHYEVSNYAKPGHRCAHNMVYWEGKPFYGIGMGSASYLQGRRFSRPKRLHGYRQFVEEFAIYGSLGGTAGGADSSARSSSSSGSSSSSSRSSNSNSGIHGGAAHQNPADDEGVGAVPGLHLPPETSHDKLLDTIMLRLRLADGLDLSSIQGRNADGEQLRSVVLRALQPHIEQGLVQFRPIQADTALNSADSSPSRGGPNSPQGRSEGLELQQQTQQEQRARGLLTSGQHGAGEAAVVSLTDPEGFVVSNDIISDVFAALDEGSADS
ncbi:hypothetical protein N2152v2_007056 [Parachlorella kessleri]